jgi:hypothetical protein
MNEEIQAYKAKRIREVAYEHRLPFQLAELSKRAEQGVQEARHTRGRKVYQEEVLQHFKDYIDDALRAAVANGSLKDEGEFGERLLTDERIREALKSFPKAKQWKHLLEGCEYDEAWVLKVFLNVNRDEFEQSLGKKNIQSIEIHAMERRLVLWGQEEAQVINISAPYWAAVFWRRAREESVSGVKPSAHDRRTVPERGSYRGIAASLSQGGEKVSDKQVKTWLDRMREDPEFKEWLDGWGSVPEIKGDWNDFFLKIADPPAWRRKHRRLKER